MKQQINEGIKATGLVNIVHKNKLGEVLNTFEVPNLVVTSGKNYIAGKMVAEASDVPVHMSHMAIGTDTTSADVAQTSLLSQAGTRVLLSGNSVTNNAITYTATFAAGNATGAITEAGIFNASTGGTMLCRTTFPVVNKQACDTIAITWVVTVS